MAPIPTLLKEPATKSGDPSAVQASPKIDSIVFALPTEAVSKEMLKRLTKLTLHYKRCQAEARTLQHTDGRLAMKFANLPRW
jgi:hypothetical protein